MRWRSSYYSPHQSVGFFTLTERWDPLAEVLIFWARWIEMATRSCPKLLTITISLAGIWVFGTYLNGYDVYWPVLHIYIVLIIAVWCIIWWYFWFLKINVTYLLRLNWLLTLQFLLICLIFQNTARNMPSRKISVLHRMRNLVMRNWAKMNMRLAMRKLLVKPIFNLGREYMALHRFCTCWFLASCK